MLGRLQEMSLQTSSAARDAMIASAQPTITDDELALILEQSIAHLEDRVSTVTKSGDDIMPQKRSGGLSRGNTHELQAATEPVPMRTGNGLFTGPYRRTVARLGIAHLINIDEVAKNSPNHVRERYL
jgi:hypothetical protein